MEKLKKEFIGTGEVKGFSFHLLCENERAYVYMVVSLPNKYHFEVFKKHTVARCVDFKNRIYDENDRKEVYPKSKDFGKWAWTATTKEKAMEKFYKL